VEEESSTLSDPIDFTVKNLIFMLWQLLKGSGYCGYGEPLETVRQNIGKLDPITCAGHADTRALHSAASMQNILFAVILLGIILDPESFRHILVSRTREGRRLKFTNVKYSQHFDDLQEFDLLKEVRAAEIEYCSTYFSVPKDDYHDRSIFNGKVLSREFISPSPVNIPDIPRLVEEMAREVAQDPASGVWIVVGDLRHWFHQIPLHKSLWKWFGLAMKDLKNRIRTFTWKCLPMGWSWSPAIAQAAAWVMIGHCETGHHRYVDLSTRESSPMFVPLKDTSGERIGFATVYYDNYMIITRDPKVAEEMSNRVVSNARLFGITIKEHQLWTRSQLVLGDARKRILQFLGIEFALRARTTREGTCQYNLWWRVGKKTNLLGPSDLPTICTPQEIARVIGRTLYSRLISLRPLGSCESTRTVLTFLRRISIAAWRDSWRTRNIRISPTEMIALENEWEHVRHPRWHSIETFNPRNIRVATDACVDGWAVVVMSADGIILWNSGKQEFTKDLHTSHIYLKELHAAIEGVVRGKTFGTEVQRIDLLVDNTAVAGTLRRMFSSNAKGMEMLGRVDIPLRIVTVPSELNVADSPSRGDCIDPRRQEASHAAFNADGEGHKLGIAKRHPNCQNVSGLRHSEGFDVDGLDDDLILDVLPTRDAVSMDGFNEKNGPSILSAA
jgi:hypothetical protein